MKNRVRRLSAVVLTICVLLAGLVWSTEEYKAVAASSGVVSVNTTLNVRQEPSSGSTVLGKLNNGDTVIITGTSGDWYEISYKDGKGYVASAYIKIIDNSYYEELVSKGFPESYATALSALHEKYPNWVFTPVNTGLKWSTVIENESRLGRNLVHTSADDSWKSTAAGAYTWETNKWAGYDGASWVAASQAAVEYCMDPRNYLNETSIYQFATLEYADYQNASGTAAILAGSFMSGEHTDGSGKKYKNSFVTAGKKYNVNPYHLAVRCLQEQGTKGTSPLISGTYSGYEGYYNYFNIGAYPANGNDSILNGLIYASNQGWDTVQKAILGGSEVVGKRYVAVGQNTLYFQKFNVVYTASLYSHQYMTNIQAATSEAANLKKGYTDTEQALEFLIPVYLNMPSSACAKPSSGNPNNYLKSLSVSGCTLTPSFSGSNTSYSVIVDASVSSADISAAAVASTSSVSGTGTKQLSFGTNTFTVKCTAQNGDVKKYTIRIVREKEPLNTITISGSSTIAADYSFDGEYVTGFNIGDSANTVISNITATDCSVKILDTSGNSYNGTIGTGCRVAVYDKNNTLLKIYTIVINGDLNGDGKVSNVDVVLMKKHILGISKLSGAYELAADTNKGQDGVSNLDLVLLKKHILNLFQLNQ